MHLKKGRIEGVEEYGASCEADALVCHFELRYQFKREQANAMLRRMDLRWWNSAECNNEASGLDRIPNGILRLTRNQFRFALPARSRQ
jgi:hypothetical protein